MARESSVPVKEKGTAFGAWGIECGERSLAVSSLCMESVFTPAPCLRALARSSHNPDYTNKTSVVLAVS